VQFDPTRDAVGRAQRIDRDLVALRDRFQTLPAYTVCVRGPSSAVAARATAIRVVLVVLVLRVEAGSVRSVRRVGRWIQSAGLAAIRIVEPWDDQFLATFKRSALPSPLPCARRRRLTFVALGDPRGQALSGIDDVEALRLAAFASKCGHCQQHATQGPQYDAAAGRAKLVMEASGRKCC